MGKKDGISPRKLLSFLLKKANINSNKVDGIQIMDSYSFFNVPFDLSEVILSRLNPVDSSQRPLVERAKAN